MSQQDHHSNEHDSETEISKPAKAEKLESSVAVDVEDEPAELEEFDEGERFGQNLKDFLGSSGFGLKSFLGCFGLLVIIALAVYIFAFDHTDLLGPVKRYLPFLKPEVSEEDFSAERISATRDDLETAYRFGFYRYASFEAPPSIQTAAIFGGIQPTMFFPASSFHTGLFTAYSIGFRGQPLVRLSQYLANISQVQNILSTNVNAVLDASSDRKVALDSLLQSFKNLLTATSENANFVKKEIITLRSNERALNDRVVASEKLFNADIAKFLPEKTAQELDEYMLIARDHSDAKARLGAMSKVDQYYQVAVVKLTARVRDIRDNQDALIKGVKVFDIKNSDIDIIIYEGQRPADPGIHAIDRTKTATGFTPFGLTP